MATNRSLTLTGLIMNLIFTVVGCFTDMNVTYSDSKMIFKDQFQETISFGMLEFLSNTLVLDPLI